TGFTCGSGYNLVASATRNGRRLIGVLLGSHTNFERHSEMGRLLDIGFATDPQTIASKVLLADLAAPERGIDSGPPVQLSPTECACGVTATSIDGDLAGSSLGSGWAVMLGASASNAQARQMLGHARAQLKSVLTGGREVIVRKHRGARLYSVLLADLS